MSGMGVVHATQQQMNQMALRCDETAASLRQGMAQLIANVEGLSGAAFNGRANTALQGTSQHLHHGLTTIVNALAELAGKMTDASARFGAQDEDAATQLRSVAADGDVARLLRA